MKKKIQPLGRNVLVKVKKVEKMTESGIVIPDTASEKKPQEGEVVAVGDSEKINPKIKKGTSVLFREYGGTELEIDSEDYRILDAKEDILAIIE